MPVLRLLQLLQPPAPRDTAVPCWGQGERLPPAAVATGSTVGAVAGSPDNKALKLPVERWLWAGEEGMLPAALWLSENLPSVDSRGWSCSSLELHPCPSVASSSRG